MILSNGTTAAVLNGETVRLFHNTGVKPGVHLVEITAAPPAPAHSGSGARHHTGSANPEEGGSTRTTSRQRPPRSEQAELGQTNTHLVLVSDPRTLGEMRKHFHRDLRGKIRGEFAKDFSRRPLEDIADVADA